MNFIVIGLLLREALDRLCVRLNMYLVSYISTLLFLYNTQLRGLAAIVLVVIDL